MRGEAKGFGRISAGKRRPPAALCRFFAFARGASHRGSAKCGTRGATARPRSVASEAPRGAARGDAPFKGLRPLPKGRAERSLRLSAPSSKRPVGLPEATPKAFPAGRFARRRSQRLRAVLPLATPLLGLWPGLRSPRFAALRGLAKKRQRRLPSHAKGPRLGEVWHQRCHCRPPSKGA